MLLVFFQDDDKVKYVLSDIWGRVVVYQTKEDMIQEIRKLNKMFANGSYDMPTWSVWFGCRFIEISEDTLVKHLTPDLKFVNSWFGSAYGLRLKNAKDLYYDATQIWYTRVT